MWLCQDDWKFSGIILGLLNCQPIHELWSLWTLWTKVTNEHKHSVKSVPLLADWKLDSSSVLWLLFFFLFFFRSRDPLSVRCDFFFFSICGLQVRLLGIGGAETAWVYAELEEFISFLTYPQDLKNKDYWLPAGATNSLPLFRPQGINGKGNK